MSDNMITIYYLLWSNGQTFLKFLLVCFLVAIIQHSDKFCHS